MSVVRVGMIVALFVLVSCGGVSEQGGSTKPDQSGVATYGGSAGLGDGALLEATMTRRDGCWYAVDSKGLTWLPVFAVEALTEASDVGFTYAGIKVSEGSAVRLGGGVGTKGAEFHRPVSCGTVANTFFVGTMVQPDGSQD